MRPWPLAAALLLAACHAVGPAAGTPAAPLAADPVALAPAAMQPMQAVAPLSRTEFGALSARLSEPAGYFQSDNVVSNETSYLHILDAVRRLGISGGVYIGVGPDQNYSYIAAVRPALAFMFDIRRDNLVEHLLFKAVFELSPTRIEYLCTLLGKPAPADPASWSGRSIGDLVAYLDTTAVSPELAAASMDRLRQLATGYGIPLDQRDLAILQGYRDAFVRFQLQVQYSSLDGRLQRTMPSWRDLLLATDRQGSQLNFLATDDAYRYVRRMHAENRIVPVTGDAAGPTALRAVGDEIRARGLTVSMLYMSNVEQYLYQYRSIGGFVENFRTLPRTATTVIVRSLFNQWGHPLSLPGHRSTSMMQLGDVFLAEWDAGNLPGYSDLMMRGYIGPD
jgi:hypothetical protein